MNGKKLNYILAVVVLSLVIKLAYKERNKYKVIYSNEITEAQEEPRTINSTHQTRVWLTVAESKRLIAKGLMNYPPIKNKLKNGYLLIAKGTTNTYVAEEALGENLRNGEYVLGNILPATTKKRLDRRKKRRELLFKDGTVLDSPYRGLMGQMNEGDIVLKGASIINYKKQQAAILIGHPTGGTIGFLEPKIKERKLRLIVPVGLEKDSSQDIELLSKLTKVPHDEIAKNTPYLWNVKAELFTEIEAIKQFADVEIIQIGSGGIGGAEGATTLNIRGNKKEVIKAVEFVNSIQGEKEYLR